jgi:hypothetical protein
MTKINFSTDQSSRKRGWRKSAGRRLVLAAGVMIGASDVVSAPATSAAPVYSITTIDPSGSRSTRVFAMNSSGDVAGGYYDGLSFHGFVRTGSTFTTVEPAVFSDATVRAMNDSGDVAGDFTDIYTRRGFVRVGGTFTTFDPPDSVTTFVSAMNSSGDVAGEYSDGHASHGFVRVGGTITTVDPPGSTETHVTAMNNSGDFAGYYSDATGTHGFVQIGGTITTVDPSGSTETHVTAMNNSGDFAGYYSDAAGTHGFVQIGGTFTNVDPPGSTFNFVNAMNSSGDVAGNYFDPTLGTRAFVRIGGTYSTFDFPGSASYSTKDVTAMNAAGNVAGYYSDATGRVHGFVAVAAAVVATQTASFSSATPPTAAVGGPSYVPTAIATSGLPVTITVDASASSVCSMNGGAVSFQAVGTCVLNANQPGNGSFSAAPQVQQSFAVFAIPAFVQASPPTTAAVVQMYTYTFQASGTPAPTYALVGAPSWVSIASGVVSGIPPSGTTSFTYRVTATNALGQASAGPFTVTVTSPVTGYVLGGFTGSVRNPPAVNVQKPGSTVPLRWTLTTSTGMLERSLGAVSSITYGSVPCAAIQSLPSSQQTAAGQWPLRNALDGTFEFNWVTPRTKGCYRVTVTLTSGQKLTAVFDLK